MQELLNQIKTALNYKLYHLALNSSLALPDMCAALQSEDGKTNGRKYAQWYDTYVGSSSSLDGQACYRFRCSALHQGHSQHENLGYSRILFVEPNPNFFFHNNIINDVLNIDINIFCLSIIDAVEKWLSIIQDDDNFKKNYPKFIRRYPNGIAPYIVGIPVIS